MIFYKSVYLKLVAIIIALLILLLAETHLPDNLIIFSKIFIISVFSLLLIMLSVELINIFYSGSDFFLDWANSKRDIEAERSE